MKKIVGVFALAALLAAGTAFADHPNGLGIGLVGGWHGGWEGGGAAGGALSLKLPNLPTFWAVNLDFDKNYFSLGLSGDHYFFDKPLVQKAALHLFLGLGGWVNLYSDDSNLSVGLGARLPIGLSWQPVKFFELFLDVAPSLGVRLNPYHFPDGGWPVEAGLRLWI